MDAKQFLILFLSFSLSTGLVTAGDPDDQWFGQYGGERLKRSSNCGRGNRNYIACLRAERNAKAMADLMKQLQDFRMNQ